MPRGVVQEGVEAGGCYVAAAARYWAPAQGAGSCPHLSLVCDLLHPSLLAPPLLVRGSVNHLGRTVHVRRALPCTKAAGTGWVARAIAATRDGGCLP